MRLATLLPWTCLSPRLQSHRRRLAPIAEEMGGPPDHLIRRSGGLEDSAANDCHVNGLLTPPSSPPAHSAPCLAAVGVASIGQGSDGKRIRCISAVTNDPRQPVLKSLSLISYPPLVIHATRPLTSTKCVPALDQFVLYHPTWFQAKILSNYSGDTGSVTNDYLEALCACVCVALAHG